ncbi:MAG TPA: hypothetical protein VH589_03445 [Trebonia sp.]
MLIEVMPGVLALLAETPWQIPLVFGGVANAAPGELGHGKVPPRIGTQPGRLKVIRVTGELPEEPVDSIYVIRPFSRWRERCCLDHRPGRTPSVKLRRDAVKQIVDLPRVIARPDRLGNDERHTPDMVAVHAEPAG